jgi:hypothetical protein
MSANWQLRKPYFKRYTRRESGSPDRATRIQIAVNNANERKSVSIGPSLANALKDEVVRVFDGCRN